MVEVLGPETEDVEGPDLPWALDMMCVTLSLPNLSFRVSNATGADRFCRFASMLSSTSEL